MPYALFCHDALLSQTYATEDEVWGHAAKAGLVVDAVADEESDSPRRILDRDYSIKACDGPLGHPPPEQDLGGGDIVSVELTLRPMTIFLFEIVHQAEKTILNAQPS